MGSAPQFPHGIIDNIVEIGKVHFLVFLPNLEKKKNHFDSVNFGVAHFYIKAPEQQSKCNCG